MRFLKVLLGWYELIIGYGIVLEYIVLKMVIYDWGSNGYWDIILFIVYEDEIVGKVVCVVFVFYFGISV